MQLAEKKWAHKLLFRANGAHSSYLVVDAKLNLETVC